LNNYLIHEKKNEDLESFLHWILFSISKSIYFLSEVRCKSWKINTDILISNKENAFKFIFSWQGKNSHVHILPGFLGRDCLPFFKSIWNEHSNCSTSMQPSILSCLVEHGIPHSGIVAGVENILFLCQLLFTVSLDLCFCVLFILGIIVPAQVRILKVSLPNIRAWNCSYSWAQNVIFRLLVIFCLNYVEILVLLPLSIRCLIISCFEYIIN